MKAHEPLDFSCRIRRPDGETRWVEFTGKPEQGEGKAAPRIFGTIKDITERKLAEESVARLAAIVESSQDAIVSQDLQGTITSWNQGAETIFGFSSEEMVGQSILRIIPPERQDEEANFMALIGCGEVVRHIETVRVRKDRSTIDVSITVSPVKDAFGTIVGISKVLRDTTERKRAEESLRQNAAVFSALIAQAPMGTYVVDAQFRVRDVNAQAVPVFANIQPLIGRDFQDILEILWGSEVGGQIAGIFRHTLETGEKYVSPSFTQTRHDLGIEQSYEWETQRVTLPNGQHGVVCYFHEITDRALATAALRASQQRIRLATEATQVGIWEWNILTNQIRWDAEMFRIYGIEPTPDGFVHYNDWTEAVVPEYLANNEAILQDTVRRCGRSERTFSIRRRNDGECRMVAAVETVRMNAIGRAEWVVGTNLDITQRVRSEEELRGLTSELSEADRRKDEFLAMLSHELRNPLAPIRSALALLHMQEWKGDENIIQKQAIEIIDRQVGNLTTLVSDLLEVSRVVTGRIHLRLETVDLNQVVRHAAETSATLFVERGHELILNLSDDEVWTYVDSVRMEEVFINLLNNAAKYTADGGRIEVWCEQTPGTNLAKFRVRDNGVGIEQNLLKNGRIFDLFTQADRSLARSAGGLGIGLSLAHRLIKLHQGTIEVHSPPESVSNGSEFLVSLPLVSPPTHPKHIEVEAPKTKTETTRVLVVDDNIDLVTMLSLILQQKGYSVQTAYTGTQGFEIALEWKPDIILSDIGLPDMDGYELAQRLRAEPSMFKNLRLVALTGYGQITDKKLAHEAGFDEHLTKPFDFDQLEKAMTGLW